MAIAVFFIFFTLVNLGFRLGCGRGRVAAPRRIGRMMPLVLPPNYLILIAGVSCGNHEIPQTMHENKGPSGANEGEKKAAEAAWNPLERGRRSQ
jgi:hypothetical protein